MAGYKNAGVPWYANDDTPAIRPREIKFSDNEKLRGKAQKMAAYRYVKDFLDNNWKSGDRFVFTTVSRKEWDRFGQKETKSQHGGKSGVLVGNGWFVIVRWDDATYKLPGLGSDRVGMFDFFHFAFHEGEVG